MVGVQDCCAFTGDLGTIDAKYDIAVSTSCAALDYVVVDNTATAQCCVEMLRRKGLGVATFLILDKQQHLAKMVQDKPTAPEGVSAIPLHSTVCLCPAPACFPLSPCLCLFPLHVGWYLAWYGTQELSQCCLSCSCNMDS